jgi:6-phosphogluconate dehydrogenase
MEQISAEKGWNLPLGTIASIWREGCIIRSQFLDLITKVFSKSSGNLLMTTDVAKMMKDNHVALRKSIADAALTGLPAPALSAALNYFDSYRQSRRTANLIQGRRDFFGAHKFERMGEEGAYRGEWTQ